LLDMAASQADVVVLDFRVKESASKVGRGKLRVAAEPTTPVPS
jgi:hypothetical protein